MIYILDLFHNTLTFSTSLLGCPTKKSETKKVTALKVHISHSPFPTLLYPASYTQDFISPQNLKTCH